MPNPIYIDILDIAFYEFFIELNRDLRLRDDFSMTILAESSASRTFLGNLLSSCSLDFIDI